MVVSDASTDEVEVVRSFLKALEAKDLESALTYLSPDVAYQNMPIPPLRGPAASAWSFDRGSGSRTASR
jgi:limonene-1,2-epoxide hydrolase